MNQSQAPEADFDMLALTDFTECPFSERHGSYSGNAGGKRGIVYQGSPWIIKYPKTTRSMRGGKLASYTTSPLSEYLGSKIYALLGIDVHETLLGVDGDKVVVACRDFRGDTAILKEFRSVKNAMTPQLNDMFDREIAQSATGDHVNLEETLFHLEHNPICQGAHVRTRVMDMMIVDAIIDNNDRNNGNWAFLSSGGQQDLAPVFDNGNAFSNKTADDSLDLDANIIIGKWLGGRSIYEYRGHQLSNKKLFHLDLPGLAEAAQRNVTEFNRQRRAIHELVEDLPCEWNGLYVCSEKRKQAYITGMDARVSYLAVQYGITGS